MRSVAAVLATTALMTGTIGAFSTTAPYQQPAPRTPAPAAAPAVRACSILPKEEVRTILGVDQKMFNLAPLQEDTIAGGGSACEYMGAGIQIDPFTPARLQERHKTSGQEWTAISDLGDFAYYHDRTKQGFGELYAAAGTHVVTVQMSVEPPNTAESVRPKAIALAKALLAKLH